MLVKIEHECDDGLMLQLTFEYTKGYQEVRYLSNGDPGYPGEPDEVELLMVRTNVSEDDRWFWPAWPAKWAKAMEEVYRDMVCEIAQPDGDY